MTSLQSRPSTEPPIDLRPMRIEPPALLDRAWADRLARRAIRERSMRRQTWAGATMVIGLAAVVVLAIVWWRWAL